MSNRVHGIHEFDTLVHALIGLPVSLAWMGYGSAIFLELGELAPLEATGRRYPASGQACISLEWDWRVEAGAQVLYGSSNSRPAIAKGIAGLQGSIIQRLFLSGSVPELSILFSNGHRLQSMVMVSGEPQWGIRLLDDEGYLSARAGQLQIGDGRNELTAEEELTFRLAEITAERWGSPTLEPMRGRCGQCSWYIPIDGDGHMLDYGVCSSKESSFDGKVVNAGSGCPVFSVTASE